MKEVEYTNWVVVDYNTAELWFNGLLMWSEVVEIIVTSVDEYFSQLEG